MDKKEDNVWIDEVKRTTRQPGDAAAEAEAEAVTAIQNVQAADTASGIPGQNQPDKMPVQTVTPETEETKRLKENFWPIAPWALAYSVFYAFCMYRNGSGITFPFFVAGSLLFFCSSFTKLGITLKKGSCFYMIAMLLLGISTFCTDDGILIFFNKLGIFLLLMSFLLRQFYDTSKWKLGKYLGSICVLFFASFGELGRPFSDGSSYNKRRDKQTDKRVGYFIIGLVIGVPLLLLVLLLLASADAVFRQMTDKLLRNINLSGILNILFRVTVLFFAAYALTAYLCKRKIREDVLVLWGLALLALLFVGVVIQILKEDFPL